MADAGLVVSCSDLETWCHKCLCFCPMNKSVKDENISRRSLCWWGFPLRKCYKIEVTALLWPLLEPKQKSTPNLKHKNTHEYPATQQSSYTQNIHHVCSLKRPCYSWVCCSDTKKHCQKEELKINPDVTTKQLLMQDFQKWISRWKCKRVCEDSVEVMKRTTTTNSVHLTYMFKLSAQPRLRQVGLWFDTASDAEILRPGQQHTLWKWEDKIQAVYSMNVQKKSNRRDCEIVTLPPSDRLDNKRTSDHLFQVQQGCSPASPSPAETQKSPGRAQALKLH